jgi:hypothetical protein
VLPGADSVSEYAASGTNVHRFLERVNQVGRDAALLEVPEDDRALCEALDVASLPTDPAAFAPEVALAYDAVTGKAREIGRGLGRAYGDVSPTEFVGTVDIAALAGDDGAFVGDWKKGWSHSRLTPPPARNLQIKAGLVAACRAWGRARGKGQIIRIFDDGETYAPAPTAFTPAQVDAAEGELVMLASRIMLDRERYAAGEEVQAVTGTHCGYCPSFQWCPANVALARELGGAPVDWKARTLALLTPENAPQVYQRMKQARAVLDEVEEAVKTYARQTPIDLGDGVVYGVRPEESRRIDGRLAEAALAEVLGDAAKEAIEPDVTLASVKRAIRKYIAEHPKENVRGALGEFEKKALEVLKARGALKVTQAGKIIEHRPKQSALAGGPGKAA